MTEASDNAKAELADVVFKHRFFGWTMWLSGAVLLIELVRHGYEWLRYGEVAKNALETVFSTPHIAWVGVQKIVDFVWSLDLIFLATAIVFLSGWLHDLYDREVVEKRSQLRKAQVKSK